MDFSVLRPKQPRKKALPPPPPVEKPVPVEKPPPPCGPFSPYMAEFQRMEGLRSVEYSNSRFWKLNFDDYPNPQQYGSAEYHHYPVGDLSRRRRQYHPNPMPPPPPHHYAPRLGLDHHHGQPSYGPPSSLEYFQPPDHHHGPPRLGLDDHHGPPGRPPPDYGYGPPSNCYLPPPHYGGY